jgi:hypothetical protein
VRADYHVPAKAIAARLHLDEFESARDGDDGTVGIRDSSDPFRAGTDASESTDDSKRRGRSPVTLSVSSRNMDLHEIGRPFGTVDVRHFNLCGSPLLKSGANMLTINVRIVYDFERINNLL